MQRLETGLMENDIETLLSSELGPVRQLGHVVEDIRTSINEWQKQGIGPWLWMQNVCLKSEYEGQTSRPLIDVALSYRGDMQIELIQQHNCEPSPYRASIESDAYGLHHLAHLCQNIDRATEYAQEQGCQLVCDIRMMGSRYVYLRAPDGSYVELLPASFIMRSLYRRGIAASKKWQAPAQPIVIDLQNVATLLASLPGAAKARLSW